jgi:hypothetical protein
MNALLSGFSEGSILVKTSQCREGLKALKWSYVWSIS